MRWIALSISALLAWAAVPALAAAYAVLLVEEGRPLATMILPPGSSATLTTAADEIVAYLRKMSGAKLAVASQGRSGPRIVLAVARGTLPEEDAFRIVTTPDEVRLLGGGEAGVLYAAYALLEDLGVRWLVPGAEGEVVPARHSVQYPQSDRTETPGYRCRFFYVSTPEGLLWAVRNRLNGFFDQKFALAHGSGYYLPPMLDSIHSFAHILPPEKYFARHPEFYALLGGKRTPCTEERNQLCTSNPQVIEILARAVRQYFQATRGARVFSIAPNDGYGWCECARCTALDAALCKSKQWRHSGQPVVSDRLCVFANAVAKRSVADMPGRELYMFAYVNYCEPPQTARPDAHVTPVICHYIPACYAHAINTPGCPDNEIYNANLRGWARIAPQAMVYAYTDKSQWLGLPRPVARPMAADIRYYRALGFCKYLAQSGAGDWPAAGPLYYLTAKLLWNPDRDPESIVRQWNEGMYGRAAGEMMAWYDAVDQVVVRSGGHYGGDPFEEARHVYTPGCLGPAARHLASALRLAESELIRARIRQVQENFQRAALGIDAICGSDQWERSGDRAALEKAQQAAAKLLKEDGSLSSISMSQYRECLENVTRTAPHVVRWQGWGPPEQKGGRTCRNADETGPGDNACGWASFSIVLDDLARNCQVTMEIWGQSQFTGLLLCTAGRGAGTDQGGVWKPLDMHGRVSGKPEWCTITFRVPAQMFDRATHRQTFGFGGDQQAWVSQIRVDPAP